MTPYEQRTVEDLREELRARNLPTSGSKSDLVARLTDSDREPQDLTVAELRDELRDRGEPVSGTKDELVARIETPEHPQTRIAGSDCVVKSDFHVGRAVNGKVCSYHAMHYDAEGNRR